MSARRVLVAAEMLGRDLARRHLALLMLLGLPLAFYAAEKWSQGGDALTSGGIGMSWAISGAALFGALASRAADARLVLDGYRPAELLIGRMVLLWSFGAAVAGGFGALMMAVSDPPRAVDLFLALLLVALVAVPLGLAVAALVPRELEGTLLIIATIGIPLSLSPHDAAVGVLPLGGAHRLLERASGDAFARGQPLLRGVGWALLLTAIAVEAWRRRVSRARPVGVWRAAVVAAVGVALVAAAPASAPRAVMGSSVVATIGVGREPLRAVSSGGTLWVSNLEGSTLSRIDEKTNSVTSTIALAGRPLGLAVDGDNVWVAEPDLGVVERVDAATNRVAAKVVIGGEPVDVAVVDGTPWVVDHRESTLVSIGGDRAATPVPVGRSPVFVAVASGTLWTNSAADRNLTQIDPTTGKVLGTVPLGAQVFAGVGDASGLWLVSPPERAVLRVDGTFLTISRFPLGRVPVAVASAAGGGAWIALKVHEVFPLLPGHVTRFGVSVGAADVSALVSDEFGVWAVDTSGNRVLRIRPPLVAP